MCIWNWTPDYLDTLYDKHLMPFFEQGLSEKVLNSLYSLQ